MNLTISKRMGLIVAGSLILILSVMLIFLLNNTESREKSKVKESVDEISDVVSQSIIFSMEQGINEIQPFIDQTKQIKDVKELRIIPSDKITKGSENLMDSNERTAISSHQPELYEEVFKNEQVFRKIKPILAAKPCLKCHDAKENDPLAVISLRYSVKKDYEAIANQRLVATVIVVASVIVLFLIVMLFLKKQVIKDLILSVNSIKKLATGDVNDIQEVSRNDEIGILSHSIKVLQQAMKRQSEVAREISEGNLSAEIILLSENDSLGKAMNTVKQSISSLINDVNIMSEAAKEGDLKRRVDEDAHSGDYKKIIRGCNETLDAFYIPIEASSKILEKMAKGDFTERLEGNYKGDFSTIKESTNEVAESMTEALMHIIKAVEATADSSRQISSSIEEMVAGTEEQTMQTSEVASAVEQMTKTIHETTKSAGTASENAVKAGKIASDGGNVVKETVEGMKRIADVVSKAAETIRQLGKGSNQIGEIIQVIDDIADQTNLLALNAAIEAARAGEMGRGFAVVADEVRKLAERTTKATKEIAEMIKLIQRNTAEAVESIEEGTEEVKNGREMANKAGESLTEIIDASNRVLNDVNQVASASEEQSATAEQISRNIEGINNISKESTKGIQLVAASAQKLNDMTSNLQDLIGKFKIREFKKVKKYSVKESSKLIESY